MDNTIYANQHGLSNSNNRSSAVDQGRLASVCMADPYMREIVGTIDYQSPEGSKDGYGKPKIFNWKNSNKLLKKGFNGVKTGNTPAAGPCLCTSYQRDKLHVIVVVLDSKNMEHRWDDSVKLTFWGIN